MTLTRTGFFAALALQFLILTGVIAFKQYTIWTGDTVVLQVVPLDPRDLFRGDYVRLRFAISSINPATVGGDDDPGYGDDNLWVELAPDDRGIWQAVAIWREHPHVREGHVALLGTVIYSSRGDRPLVTLEYGIEEVFVPEGTGRAIETAAADSVTLEARVDRFGRAVARRILIDGRPHDVDQR